MGLSRKTKTWSCSARAVAVLQRPLYSPAAAAQGRRLVLLTHVAKDGRGLSEAQLAVDICL